MNKKGENKMSFSLDQLTEGIQARNVGIGNRRLLEKWGRTGLLRGLEGVKRENMATMLENQAGQALREASNLGGGTPASSDIRGFTNIAFPIVRRVFGGLIANELVSIQPMSLPSGLLFYLDYTYGTDVGGDAADVDGEKTYAADDSIYGDPVNPKRSGADAIGGQYDLAGTGYSKKHTFSHATCTVAQVFEPGGVVGGGAELVSTVALTADAGSWVAWDPVVMADIGEYTLIAMPKSAFIVAGKLIDVSMPQEVNLHIQEALTTTMFINVPAAVQSGTSLNVRRLNRLIKGWSDHESTLQLASEDDYTHMLMVVRLPVNKGLALIAAELTGDAANHLGVSGVNPAGSDSSDLSTIVSPAFESSFPAAGTSDIPEIDIKIESVSVVAQTRKLRAKWSPELAQDLNAYHSLDAEVELTQILSEQIALEIDREILGDLLRGAQAANYYWSRSPGNFVNKKTGVAVSRATSLRPGPAFTGTVREWYETLIETIIDVANEIHRRTLRGAANFIVVSPEIATVLEASILYKPSLSLDSDGQVASPMSIGAEAVGTLTSRFTVYKDPYFPRNRILVGFKGGSYLETGYVYAPYVPLIVTPTIFQPEDFTPRKGVMTRYGKKMVRGDFYGTVTCLDMDII
jgi:hypothetical protein